MSRLKMDHHLIVVVLLVLYGTCAMRVEAVTATLCDTSFETPVIPCCHLSNYINSSSVVVKYTSVPQEMSADKPWRLDVNISWQNTPFNRSTKYAVNLDLTIGPDDVTRGSLPTDLRQGQCQIQFSPYKYPQYPSSSCTVPQQWDIVDEPYFTKQDLLFGFNYRIVIREYDGTVASAYTTCLTGYTYPSLMITPDCYSETGDAEFCATQPILVSGAVVNASVKSAYEETDEFNIPSLTVLLGWNQPIQLNGNISLYVVEIINEGSSVYFNRYSPENNFTLSPDMILRIPDLPISSEDYLIRILPFVALDPGIFSTFGTIRDFYDGAEQTLRYTYTRPTEPLTSSVTSVPTTADVPVEPTNEGGSSNTLVYIVSGVGAVSLVLLVLAIIIVVHMNKRTQKKAPEVNWTFQPVVEGHSFNLAEKRLALVDDEFKDIEILDHKNIKEEEELGRGQYGVVYKGQALLRGKTTWEVVALKKPKTNSGFEAYDALEDFKNEIRLILELGKHPKIVAAKGCCTVDEPFYMITDYLEYGDLLHFLRKCCDPESWNRDPIYRLSPINQVQIAAQIADGMNYVSTTRFFHGDLAARNILVGSKLLVKIADFGLTDDLYQKGYTRLRAGKNRPFKWYGPETLEHQYCTLKTDIWSYGVLLWEVYGFCLVSPYHGMSIQEVRYRLKEGYRLPPPSRCPQTMYEIMLACWNQDPDGRPPFSEIYDALITILEKMGDEYCLLDEDETYKMAQSQAKRMPSLIDSIIDSLNLTDDYSSWATSSISGTDTVFTGSSFVSDANFGSGGKFAPIIEAEESRLQTSHGVAKTITDDGNGSTNDGNGSTNDGNGSTNDGNGSTNDGNGSTNDGNGLTNDGNGSTNDGNGSTNDGNGSTIDGNGLTND